jgi:hypothetical protein
MNRWGFFPCGGTFISAAVTSRCLPLLAVCTGAVSYRILVALRDDAFSALLKGVNITSVNQFTTYTEIGTIMLDWLKRSLNRYSMVVTVRRITRISGGDHEAVVEPVDGVDVGRPVGCLWR